MFCSKCGNEVIESNIFCKACGSNLQNKSAQLQEENQVDPILKAENENTVESIEKNDAIVVEQANAPKYLNKKVIITAVFAILLLIYLLSSPKINIASSTPERKLQNGSYDGEYKATSMVIDSETYNSYIEENWVSTQLGMSLGGRPFEVMGKNIVVDWPTVSLTYGFSSLKDVTLNFVLEPTEENNFAVSCPFYDSYDSSEAFLITTDTGETCLNIQYRGGQTDSP